MLSRFTPDSYPINPAQLLDPTPCHPGLRSGPAAALTGVPDTVERLRPQLHLAQVLLARTLAALLLYVVLMLQAVAGGTGALQPSVAPYVDDVAMTQYCSSHAKEPREEYEP